MTDPGSVGATPQSQQQHTTTSPEGASMSSHPVDSSFCPSCQRIGSHADGCSGEAATTREEIAIEAFSLYGAARPLHYLADPDALPMNRGEDHAAVMIRLDVDGDHDNVSVDLNRSDALTVLERSIEALQRIYGRLQRIEPADGRRWGRCMTAGDWGRCKLRDMHEEPHDFPTEEEWTAEREALGKPYPRSA